jgi:hypothetical protein
MLLLDHILQGKLDNPFKAMPPEGPLPVLSKHEVVKKDIN